MFNARLYRNIIEQLYFENLDMSFFSIFLFFDLLSYIISLIYI